MGTSFYFVGWSLKFHSWDSCEGLRSPPGWVLQEDTPLLPAQPSLREPAVRALCGSGNLWWPWAFPPGPQHPRPVTKSGQKLKKNTLTSIFPVKRSSNEDHLSDSNRHGQGSQLLVKGHEHTWLHGCHQAVEDVVRFPQDYCRIQSEHQEEHEQRNHSGNVALKRKKKPEMGECVKIGKWTHCFWRQGRKRGQWAARLQPPDSSAACRCGRDRVSVFLCPGESDPAGAQTQTVNISFRTSKPRLLSPHTQSFTMARTWASRTMKRLLGSLAWYWASCLSMAARRALFVPGENKHT